MGSTSIPGMLAKPIIDIAIAVADFEDARVCIPLMEGLGYEYKGEFGIPLRHYFVKGDPRTFHVHMSEITSLEWQNTLLFRDYLCQHADLAAEYAELKTRLALKYPQDRTAYLDGKTEFVQRVLQIARAGLEHKIISLDLKYHVRVFCLLSSTIINRRVDVWILFGLTVAVT